MIEIKQDNSVQEFLREAGTLLYQHEATNSLMLGICEGMQFALSKNSAIFLRILENGVTVSAAVQTPPMNLVLTNASYAQLENLATYLLQQNIRFPGVVGPATESEEFAKIWSEKLAVASTLGMGQKIYMLEKVLFPKTIPGSFREASFDELDLVSDWIRAFARESLPSSDQRDTSHWREFAKRAVQNQTAHFWIADGKPVSMAFSSRPTRNGISVNGVYTPPSQRKKGYASAVVAFLSQKMLDAGKKFCVLYTDLANPTSNKIYQSIGYVEVSDSKHHVFL